MIEIDDWGLTPYLEAQERQLDWVQKVQEDADLEKIVLCTHPPVATLGRKTQESDLFGWDGEAVEVQRGGRVTYHGPNQIVGYPIISLQQAHVGFGARDLHGYIRNLESVIMRTLQEFGVGSDTAPSKEFLQLYKDVEATGVWVGDRKLASIGIGVKKWVTFHGFAVNFDADEKAFRGMNPCGFSQEVPVSVAEVASQKIERSDFVEVLKGYLRDSLSRA